MCVVMRYVLLLAFIASLLGTTWGFHSVVKSYRRRRCSYFFQRPTPAALNMAGGKKGTGGGGGFGSSKKEKKKKITKSDIQNKKDQIFKTYGDDIAQGTAQRVQLAMKSLPDHLQLATQLYQQLQKWNAREANLSLWQQATLESQDVLGAKRAQEELDRLFEEYDFTEHDLHNVFQRVTWDASADAKAARAIMGGTMSSDVKQRVNRACDIVTAAVHASPNGKYNGACLDVGCGFGVLVPFLTKVGGGGGGGIQSHQIHGVDLSPEMTRNAQEQHLGVKFSSVDYIKDYQNEGGFDGIILCSALHDFSDPVAVLEKSVSLLRPNGKLVILHPQGASHVQRQSNANPVLVKRGLPTAQELKSMNLPGMVLEIEPAAAKSKQELTVGYLAVLVKKE